MNTVIETKGLVKTYNKKFKLGELDIAFPKGFSTALIGANGAGKTTLMDIICGITAATHGEINYFGEATDADSGDIKERIGYCAAQGFFPPSWKPSDIALSMGLAFESFDKERFYKLCKELGVMENEKKQKSLSQMSDGNKMRTYLASVFARKTQLLVLDEPGSSLDPLMRDRLCDRFRDYIDSGNGENSIIFSTHNIADMENAADYAVFMDKGRVIEQGFIEQLKDKYTIVSADAADKEKIAPLMLSVSGSKNTVTGLALAKNRLRLEQLGAATERPALQQLSIELLKIAESDCTFGKEV